MMSVNQQLSVWGHANTFKVLNQREQMLFTQSLIFTFWVTRIDANRSHMSDLLHHSE